MGRTARVPGGWGEGCRDGEEDRGMRGRGQGVKGRGDDRSGMKERSRIRADGCRNEEQTGVREPVESRLRVGEPSLRWQESGKPQKNIRWKGVRVRF